MQHDLPRIDEANASIVIICNGGARFAALTERLRRHGLTAEMHDAADALPAASGLYGDLFLIEHPVRSAPVWPILREIALIQGTDTVVVLGRDDPVDRIVSIEMGAADCVGPQCSDRELVARVRSLLRRRNAVALPPATPIAPAEPVSACAPHPVRVRFSRWEYDGWRRELKRDGLVSADMTPQDLRLLGVFVRSPRKTVRREDLLDPLDRADDGIDRAQRLRTIDVAISRLRRHLRSDGEEVIRTVRARGYVLLPDVVPLD